MSPQPEPAIQLGTAPIETIDIAAISAFCREGREEGIDLDYKSDWPRDLDKLLCAFANTQGGLLLIGVEEEGKSRKPKCPAPGVEGPEEALHQRVMNVAFDAVYPPIMPEVRACAVPGSSGRFVVLVRVSPSRLMHSSDRRTRIYVRVADSSRGYELASLADLEWLWAQRAKSDLLRDRLMSMAIERSSSPAIPWHSDAEQDTWAVQPLLTVAVMPTFPVDALRVESRALLDKANSLAQVRTAWKLVDRRVPWQVGLWRSLPGAVCLSDRGHGSSLQYIEIGQLGHIYAAFSLETRDLPAASEGSAQRPRCHAAYVLLAYLQACLQFAARFLDVIAYPWPITVSATLHRAQTAVVYYKLPTTMDPFDLDWLSPPCPDETVPLLMSEMPARELAAHQDELMLQAVKSLTWAYGLGWDGAQVGQWYKKLTS